MCLHTHTHTHTRTHTHVLPESPSSISAYLVEGFWVRRLSVLFQFRRRHGHEAGGRGGGGGLQHQRLGALPLGDQLPQCLQTVRNKINYLVQVLQRQYILQFSQTVTGTILSLSLSLSHTHTHSHTNLHVILQGCTQIDAQALNVQTDTALMCTD